MAEVTKEEVLSDISAIKLYFIKDKYNKYTPCLLISDTLKSMDKWAKIDSIGFAEWMGQEVNPFIKHKGRWIQACGNSTSWTIEQLYAMYEEYKQSL